LFKIPPESTSVCKKFDREVVCSRIVKNAHKRRRMRQFFSIFKELKEREALISLTALFLMCIYLYHGIPRVQDAKIDGLYMRIFQSLSVFFLFFLVPALIIKFYFRENLKDFGLQKGDFRFGIKFLIIAIIVVLPFIYFSSFQQDFQKEYPLPLIAREKLVFLIVWEFFYLFYYIGWEFLFRGYLLFGLERRLGWIMAIIFQTLPSTLIHWNKPEAETFSAILAGIVLGAVALRTRSILYPLFLHYLIGASMDIFCVMNSK
jgi:membrane protease YdiL (CAAX protease family)